MTFLTYRINSILLNIPQESFIYLPNAHKHKRNSKQ